MNSRHQAVRLAWPIWGVAVLLWAVSFWVRSIARVGADGDRVAATLAFLVLFTAGALVASRRPESPFGWIMLTYGLVAGVEGTAIGYALGAAGNDWPLGDATALAWVGSWVGLVGSALP